MAGVWTDPVDRADGYVVGQTVWNQNLGDTGNTQYLYESHRYKLKTASQSFAATTTFADVTATSGNLAFAIAASEVWYAEWRLYVNTEVTGGYKWQLTGPAAPTAVQIGAGYQTPGDGGAIRTGWDYLPSRTASFSSNILTVAGGLSAGATTQVVGGVIITALIVNGANAGTVTLQGAQNSASGTTTIASGHMVAQRLLVA